MDGTVGWIINGFVGLAAILGLFLAARAADTGFYAFGLLLFLFGVLFIFMSIRKAFDEREAAAAARRTA